MVDLTATPPITQGLPKTIGAATLTLAQPDVMWSVAPFRGRDAAVAKALGDLPAPNRSKSRGGTEITWFSRGEFMVIGTVPDAGLAKDAALTDQSDAWCVLELKGAGAEDVLARLAPVDLRQRTVKRGHCLRTQLNHMGVHITRTGNEAFRLMCFRSMAGTMVHELTDAMDALRARG
ncbi:MAG: sarcosine oxidase subunit gamma [Pseudomonadota bacterium]